MNQPSLEPYALSDVPKLVEAMRASADDSDRFLRKVGVLPDDMRKIAATLERQHKTLVAQKR